MVRKNFIVTLLGAIPAFNIIKNMFIKDEWGTVTHSCIIDYNNVLTIKDIENAVIELEKCKVESEACLIVYQDGKPVFLRPASLRTPESEKFLYTIDFSES